MPSVWLAPGQKKILKPGAAGERETSYLVWRAADPSLPPQRTVLHSAVVREPKPGILAVGVNGDASLAQLARRGFTSTVKVTGSAMRMVATAYSPTCDGCSGRTKSGQWAGLGIVAVDPRVIPLGTRLYIPGYGQAVAGDVGGAIRGNRIDLGFRSTTDATEFGTRPILVYLIGK